MSITPTKLKAVLGDEALNELFLLLEEKTLDGRREILSHLDILEHEVGGLKSEFREFRLEVSARFDRMNADFGERFDRMSADFGERFDRMNTEFNNRFIQMSAQFDDRLDRMTAESNNRFDQMNDRFDRMNTESNNRFDRLQEQIGSMTKWTVGTMALFGTLITILLAIGQFVH